MGVTKKTKNQGDKGPRNTQRTSTSKSGGKTANNQGAQPKPSDGLAELREAVWQLVASIPKGKVASYGQIAKLAGYPSHSRYVGRTLRQLPKGSKLPWHRVVNSSLRIAERADDHAAKLQRQRLEKEGVEFIGELIARAHRWEL